MGEFKFLCNQTGVPHLPKQEMFSTCATHSSTLSSRTASGPLPQTPWDSDGVSNDSLLPCRSALLPWKGKHPLDNCFSPSFHERHYYALNIYVSAQILTLKFWPPKMIIGTGRAFGRCSSCQGGILMNGMSVLPQRLQRDPLAPFTGRHQLWPRKRVLVRTWPC